MDKLTNKQEKFAQKDVELGNASEAYRQSYNAEKMTDKQIWEESCKLKASPKVAQRIKELKEEHAKRHKVTIDSLTKELEEARELARKEKQTASMVSATLGKAKMHGLIVDKQQLSGDENKPIKYNVDIKSTAKDLKDILG